MSRDPERCGLLILNWIDNPARASGFRLGSRKNVFTGARSRFNRAAQTDGQFHDQSPVAIVPATDPDTLASAGTKTPVERRTYLVTRHVPAD